jgi:hypothetical protein
MSWRGEEFRSIAECGFRIADLKQKKMTRFRDDLKAGRLFMIEHSF